MQTLTYDDLTGGLISRHAIETLAKSGELDAAAFRRIDHLARFYNRLGTMRQMKPGDIVGEKVTEQFLQRLWKETAATGDTEKPTRPLLDMRLSERV